MKTNKHMTREDYLDATQRSVPLRILPPRSDLSLTHSPFIGASSRPYRQVLRPFQAQALWPGQTGINTIRPRSSGALPVEVVAALTAPRRSIAYSASAKARARVQTRAHKVVLCAISNVRRSANVVLGAHNLMHSAIQVGLTVNVHVCIASVPHIALGFSVVIYSKLCF